MESRQLFCLQNLVTYTITLHRFIQVKQPEATKIENLTRIIKKKNITTIISQVTEPIPYTVIRVQYKFDGVLVRKKTYN